MFGVERSVVMSIFGVFPTVLVLLLATSRLQLAEAVPSQEAPPITTSQYFTEITDKPSPLFRAFGIGMTVASAADVVTTEWALRQPYNYESNPLMTNQGVRFAAHAAVPVVAWWTTEWMERRGRGRAALLLRIGITAGYSALAVHNMRMALRN
jgi:hypothetical protein